MKKNISNEKQNQQSCKTGVSSSFSLIDYDYLDIKTLQKISSLLDKIQYAFGINDNIPEEIVDFLMKPFEEVLKHNGVNLSEQDF